MEISLRTFLCYPNENMHTRKANCARWEENGGRCEGKQNKIMKRCHKDCGLT